MIAIIPDAADQEMLGLHPTCRVAAVVLGQPRLHRLEQSRIDDALVLTVVDLLLVREPPDIDRVTQDGVEMPAAEGFAAGNLPLRIDLLGHEDAGILQLCLQSTDGTEC